MAESIRLALEFLQSRPVDAARILEAQPPELAAAFLQRSPVRLAGMVVAEMLPGAAAACLAELPAPTAASLLRQADLLRAAAILRRLTASQRKPVIESLPTAKSAAAELLLRHAVHEVGAWMDPRALVLPDEGDVGDALRRLRQDDVWDGSKVFVASRASRLRGVVPWHVLLTSDHNLALSRVMSPARHVLPARASLASVREHPGWSNADMLPVVDRRDHFVGALRHADLRRGLRATEAEPDAREGEPGLLGFVEAYWAAVTGLLEITVAAPEMSPPATGRKRRAR